MSEDARTGGAPTRTYVILERLNNEDQDGFYYVELIRLEARNANGALRKAWNELDRRGEENVMLVPVPENQWRPRAVSGRRVDDYSVEIADPDAEVEAEPVGAA